MSTLIVQNPLLQLFAKLCMNLNNDEIYTLFEDHLSEEMREAVYSVSDPESPEPFREACEKIGTAFNVYSLINY